MKVSGYKYMTEHLFGCHLIVKTAGINLPLFSTVVPAIILYNSWDDGGK